MPFTKKDICYSVSNIDRTSDKNNRTNKEKRR